MFVVLEVTLGLLDEKAACREAVLLIHGHSLLPAFKVRAEAHAGI